MSESAPEIPVIDFGPFLEGSASSRQAVAMEMRQASREWGFFYLANCGMPEAQLAEAFAASRAFFSLPVEEKNRVAWQNAESNRGYVGIKRERLDPTRPGDLKEAFNLAPEQPEPGAPRNQWPAGQPDFEAVMTRFLGECIATADRVLE
ncbi:MAG: 2-oxoglutarate and iron-dependent oxygenase domain-containing protein, partial [Marinobacter sp.]